VNESKSGESKFNAGHPHRYSFKSILEVEVAGVGLRREVLSIEFRGKTGQGMESGSQRHARQIARAHEII